MRNCDLSDLSYFFERILSLLILKFKFSIKLFIMRWILALTEISLFDHKHKAAGTFSTKHPTQWKTNNYVNQSHTETKRSKKIPCLRTENLKNHTLFRGTYLYSPYMRVPPPGKPIDRTWIITYVYCLNLPTPVIKNYIFKCWICMLEEEVRLDRTAYISARAILTC